MSPLVYMLFFNKVNIIKRYKKLKKKKADSCTAEAPIRAPDRDISSYTLQHHFWKTVLSRLNYLGTFVENQ